MGNTYNPAHIRVPAAVHPHACGEHDFNVSKGTATAGSSPRMWGTPPCHAQPCHALRFIPTHVGNTKYQFVTEARNAVHPHACGEHIEFDASLRGICGSSPRMWGTLFFYLIKITDVFAVNKSTKIISMISVCYNIG